MNTLDDTALRVALDLRDAYDTTIALWRDLDAAQSALVNANWRTGYWRTARPAMPWHHQRKRNIRALAFPLVRIQHAVSANSNIASTCPQRLVAGIG